MNGAAAAWVAVGLAVLAAVGAGLWRAGTALWKLAPIVTAAAEAAPHVDQLAGAVAELTGEVRGWKEATDRRMTGIETRLNSLNGSTL